jgi:hypothetical protein
MNLSGMSLAPVDVEHVGAERRWRPSDALGGHLRAEVGDRRVERLNLWSGVSVWPRILPERIRLFAVDRCIRSQT